MNQTWYVCTDKSNGTFTRYTKDSFDLISSNRWYQERVDCQAEFKTKQVCYCPAGYTDYLCSTKEFTKCYVNFTNPALHEGCKDDYEDSEYYMYSIQGFDPCHFYDFSKEYTFQYKLKCMAVNAES